MLGGLGLASLLASLLLTRSHPPLAYLGSPTRAWQFAVGGLLALASPRFGGGFGGGGGREPVGHEVVGHEPVGREPVGREPVGREPVGREVVWRAVLGWAGLVAIIWSCAFFGARTPYPGLAALVPTLGTAAVIAAGSAGMGARQGPGRLLSSRALVAVGGLSFCWYLWHWPVVVLAEERFGPLTWPVRLALVMASAVPAWATMRLVERPVRYSASDQRSARPGARGRGRRDVPAARPGRGRRRRAPPGSSTRRPPPRPPAAPRRLSPTPSPRPAVARAAPSRRPRPRRERTTRATPRPASSRRRSRAARPA